MRSIIRPALAAALLLAAPATASAQQQTEYEKRQAEEVRAQRGLRDEAARTAQGQSDARAAGDKARADQRELDRLKAAQGASAASVADERYRESQRRAAAAAADEASERRYAQSVRQNRTFRDIIGNAGAFEDAGDLKRAIAEYNRAEPLIQTVPNQVEVYLSRGRLERRAGMWGAAIADLKRGTDIQHSYASPYIDLAWAYYEAGDAAATAETLKDVQITAKFESNAGDKVRTLLAFGALYLRMGRYAEARTSLQAALSFTDEGKPYLKDTRRAGAADLLELATLKGAGKPVPEELAFRAPTIGLD